MKGKRRTSSLPKRSDETIKCGFCGYDFPVGEGIKGCGRCGLPERCHMVRCPRCFYENPIEPLLVKKIKSLFK